MSKESKLKHKKWVEEKEKTGSLKKPKTCRGGKPHDFVLLVPFYLKRNLPLTHEQTLRYYELQEIERLFKQQQNEEYQKIGLTQFRYSFSNHYFYRCAVCGKEKYEDKIIKAKVQIPFRWGHGRLVFRTEEDALAYFQETEGVNSDDVDKEEARFERWFEDCNIKIEE